MAEAESEVAVRLLNKAPEKLKSPNIIALPSSKEHKSSYFLTKSLAKMVEEDPKSFYFLTKSLAKMVDEDPIRLQNQSCAIRKETVWTWGLEQLDVYSSLARLPTFSIGLSSTWGEEPPQASLRERSVDPKDKSPLRYFQMPELGARVFVGNVDGSDTITCHLLHYNYRISKSDLDSEFAAVRSIFKGDDRGELRGWIRAQPAKFRRSKHYFDVILSGTKLFNEFTFNVSLMVENLGGKSSRVSGSNCDSKDRAGDEIIRQPSDVVGQPGDHVPSVHCIGPEYWKTDEGPNLLRFPKGSYLKKPEFMNEDDLDRSSHDHYERHALQLTRFDDFIILCDNSLFNPGFRHNEAIDIVQKNASETADVIAAQLVKRATKKRPFWTSNITVIVIFLEHKEILLKEKENMAQKDIATLSGLSGSKAISQAIALRDDKEIAEFKEEEKIATFKEEEKIAIFKEEEKVFAKFKEEEKITTFKEEKKIFAKSKGEEKIATFKEEEKVFVVEMEDKKGIMMEEDYKVKILVGEPLPNVPQISTTSLEENEEQLGMKAIAISSKLTTVEVQDNSKASSSIALIEDDDCKNRDCMVSHHITKWIIYGDLRERTLLCFFNVDEEQYEFYFEDHESMATIIGLGVPHSKVVLKYKSLHVTIVEIPKEDWDVVWSHSDAIPLSIPKGNVLRQETFPDILHCIANIIDTDNIVSTTNDGGVGENNGKGKFEDNAKNGKGKDEAYDHDNCGNTSHPNGGSNGNPNDNDNKERKGKDGNDDEKNSCDQDDKKTSNDGKEVQAIVYLLLRPGGVLKEKGKKKGFGEVCEKEGEEKKKELDEVHEGVEKKEEYLPISRALKKSGNGNVVGNQQKSTTTSGIEEKEKKKEFGEICEEEGEEKMKELDEGHEGVEKKKKNPSTFWHVFKQSKNGNVVGNQQKSTTTSEVENGDDESLQKQLKEQIHAEMVFTFTIKDEAGGQLKTIQATIDPITFQIPPQNKKNYLQRRRFGWFHEKLKVAFGVVNPEVAYLDAKSYKVLESSEVEELSSQGTSKENSKTHTNAYKVKGGFKYGIMASGEYDRTNGSEAKTINEVQNSWKTNIRVTKGDYSISNHTNLNSQQLKYSYRPRSPFKEKEFQEIGEDDRLDMYHLNPICQSQQVSCEGTWCPCNSKKLEPYKLEASRELRMTKIYNLESKTIVGKKHKGVWIVEKNLPLCFIQKLEKVMYLNHSMSHLTIGVYRLREIDAQSNPSTFLFQKQYDEEPKWPSNDRLVDVKP